jgi:hypothetical protein
MLCRGLGIGGAEHIWCGSAGYATCAAQASEGLQAFVLRQCIANIPAWWVATVFHARAALQWLVGG